MRGEAEAGRSGRAEADGQRVTTAAGGTIKSSDERVVGQIDQLLDVTRRRVRGRDDQQTQRTAARPPQQHQSTPLPRLHHHHHHIHSQQRLTATNQHRATTHLL